MHSPAARALRNLDCYYIVLVCTLKHLIPSKCALNITQKGRENMTCGCIISLPGVGLFWYAVPDHTLWPFLPASFLLSSYSLAQLQNENPHICTCIYMYIVYVHVHCVYAYTWTYQKQSNKCNTNPNKTSEWNLTLTLLLTYIVHARTPTTQWRVTTQQLLYIHVHTGVHVVLFTNDKLYLSVVEWDSFLETDNRYSPVDGPFVCRENARTLYMYKHVCRFSLVLLFTSDKAVIM